MKTRNTPAHAARVIRDAFSMVELLVAMSLLTLIVLALMAVFSSTQRAFRASMTQTDMLEGGRAAMDMAAADLRAMVPSDGISNYITQGPNTYYGAVNFQVYGNNSNSYPYLPLVQSLPGSSVYRTNLLQYFFVLGRINTKWTAAGYVVNSGSSAPLYPLYRYYAETNTSVCPNPIVLYWQFLNMINFAQWTNMSHVMDGVVHLVVRAYDPGGFQITNTFQYKGDLWGTNHNIAFAPYYPVPGLSLGEVGLLCYSNAIPAAVELQMGVVEDRTLQRAESLGNGQAPSLDTAQWQYLQGQSGHIHLFRQRISIPNVDVSAYQ